MEYPQQCPHPIWPSGDDHTGIGRVGVDVRPRTLLPTMDVGPWTLLPTQVFFQQGWVCLNLLIQICSAQLEASINIATSYHQTCTLCVTLHSVHLCLEVDVLEMENTFLAARGKIQFKMLSAQHSEVLKHYECTQYSTIQPGMHTCDPVRNVVPTVKVHPSSCNEGPHLHHKST